MKFIVLFVFLLLSSQNVLASAGCFSQHFRDAILINEQRKNIYASFKNGYTRKISDRLISMEKRMMIPAWISDQWTHFFHQKGISVLCTELQDMSLTPPMPTALPLSIQPSRKDFISFDMHSLRKSLNSSLSLGMDQFTKQVQHQLELLEKEPRVNCLVRHFLESLRSFAKSHQRNILNLPTTERKWFSAFTKLLLKGHIYYLHESHEIDKLALEAQVDGLPIICQDVPPIPDIYQFE